MSLVASADLFAALASELQLAGELCEKLERVVARLASGGLTTSPESAIRDAQAVDALAQHIQGLATFAEALSTQRETAGGFDVGAPLSSITLAALASRLAGELGHGHAAQGPAHEEGELQLF